MPIMAGPRNNLPIEIDIRQFQINANLLRDSVFRMAKQLGDMTEPLTTSVTKVAIPSIIKNFSSGGRPQWESLSQARIDARLKQFNPMLRILIDTEKLAKAATSRFTWRISKTEADMEALDNAVPYAKFHQSGTKNMPQRQFALLQANEVDQIVDIFDKWIQSVANNRDFWPYFDRGF